MKSVEYRPIGIIHSPYKKQEGMPIQPSAAYGVQGWIEIQREFKEGLKDLSGFSHLILLYHFHLVRGAKLVVTPYLDHVTRGVFSTRAPVRPNPIGLSVVRLRGVKGARLEISDVDILDGTPLLDIKPYVPEVDNVDAVSIGWLSGLSGDLETKQADDRFHGHGKTD